MLLSSYNDNMRLQAALIFANLSKVSKCCNSFLLTNILQVEDNRAKIREVGGLRALIACIHDKGLT